MDFVFLCRSIHGSRTTSRRRHRLRMARIRQACGTTCASTTTVPRGRSCRDSESATSMTVAIVLGGRAKLSRRTSTGEVFCLSLGLDLQSMVENSRAMIRATRVDDVFRHALSQPKTRLSSDHLKEKTPHDKIGLSTEIVRGPQEGFDVGASCEEDEDGKSARTHRCRRHKTLEGNLVQGDVGIPVCWLPHLPRSAWCLQLHGRWHLHG